MKKLLFLLFLTYSGFVAAQAPSSGYKLIDGGDYVKSKNYYLLTLLENDQAVKALLEQDKELSKLTADKLAALKESMASCKDGLCLAGVSKFSDDEIRLVSSRLTALYKTGNALDKLVKTQLIPSGTYVLYKVNSPLELLIKAWEQDASALNYTLGVYAEGKKPNYPNIDSISYKVNAKSYYIVAYDASAVIYETVKNQKLFFEPTLQAALIYLEINERKEASYYEPMTQGENKAAYDKIKTTNWSKFPYSHILVPGAGPDNLTTPLSGMGMLRCRLAAMQYNLGKAPFIVVSGGNAHPYKTKYNEAIEMKKFMISTMHIPASAIIIDPHARHTTTNIRNDVRLVFRYGMPFNKPGYIITDKYQTDMIVNMADRCEKELKYVPYKLGKRVSETELEFYPVIESLQIDNDEPLDP